MSQHSADNAIHSLVDYKRSGYPDLQRLILDIGNNERERNYKRNGILVTDTVFSGIVGNNIVKGEHHDYDIKVTNNDSSNVILRDNHADNIFQ